MLFSFKDGDHRRCRRSIYNLGSRALLIHALLTTYRARFGPTPQQPPTTTTKSLTAAGGLNEACRRVLHRTLSQQKSLFTAATATAKGDSALASSDKTVATVAATVCGGNVSNKAVGAGGGVFQRKGLRKSFTLTGLGSHLYGSKKKIAR